MQTKLSVVYTLLFSTLIFSHRFILSLTELITRLFSSTVDYKAEECKVQPVSMDSGEDVETVTELHVDNKCEQVEFLWKPEEVQELPVQYEERVTALHSTEPSGLQQFTTTSGDEFSELSLKFSCSKKETSDENRSMVFRVETDNRSDLNLELQQVLTELESAVCVHRKNHSLSVVQVDRYIAELVTAGQQWELANQREEEVKRVPGEDFYPGVCEERVRWEKELEGLREENKSLREELRSKDEEQSHTKATVNAIQEERDHLRHSLRELQTHIQSVQADGGQFTSGSVTSAEQVINPNTGETDNSSNRNVHSSAKVSSNVQHLAQSLQDVHNIQSIFHTQGFTVSDTKIQEFQVETERLNSRIEHLKSQNDLLTITLEECKSNTERMSKLVDKYESNATALRLSLHYSEQCMKAYELLLSLTETEQDLLPGQNNVPTVGYVAGQAWQKDVPLMLRRAEDCGDTVTKDLPVWQDGSCERRFTVSGCDVQPWKGLSTKSHTSTTSCDTDVSKEDEEHLKDYIKQLKNDRAAVKLTILKLESVHTDFLSCDIKPHADSHRLDLENAVLMQELMAMKEEMAEMKAHLYLLEKEKKTLELKLSTQETCEQAYLVQIEHLKSEVEEQQEQRRSQNFTGSSSKDKCAKGSSVIKVSELTGISDSDPAAELTNVLQKELKLKVRVKDLLAALEKLTKCSEIRNQQSSEFVGDFKQANSNLVAAYEKAQKKHQNKLKKLETQMVSMVERQETEVCLLRQRITFLEEEISHLHTNETSL